MPRKARQSQSRLLATAALLGAFLLTQSNTRAQNALATPESVIKAYLAVPTSQWQNRLPFVSDAEKARPLMEKWYGDRKGSPVGYEVSGVTGSVDPNLYPAIGDSHNVFAEVTEEDGRKVKAGMTVVRTTRGFQIDWLQSLKPELLEKGLWEEGRLAEDQQSPEIRVKHLDAVGERYVNKPVKMLTAKFNGISNTGITSIPGVMVGTNGLVTRYDKKAADAWVGFTVSDRDGNLGFYFFAPKEKWADVLLEMKKGQLLNLAGVVTELEHSQSFGVLVYDIEILKP